MYADDLLFLSEDEEKTINAIWALNDWCQSHRMLVNASKSAILRFPFNALQPFPSAINIAGLPVTPSYKKQAWCWTSLSAAPHITAINKKIAFIIHRLTPLRHRKHTKLNINLFKIFVLPMYRLALSIFDNQSPLERLAFVRDIRKNLKRFLALPRNTSNDLVDQLLGDTLAILTHEMAVTREKVTAREHHRKPNLISIAKMPPDRLGIHHFPANISTLTQLMYSHKCRAHDYITQ